MTLSPVTSTRAKGVKAMNLGEDSSAAACIYHHDNEQLLVVSSQCAMKRVKISDVPVLGRPTRGIRICKNRKTKPFVISHIRTFHLNDGFMIAAKENAYLLMKDISLMSLDATFSNPLKNSEDFYFYEPFSRIEDEPAVKQEVSDEALIDDEMYDDEYIDGQISLFDEE